jgi:hypothetical protein
MRLGRLLVIAILILVAGRMAAGQEIRHPNNSSDAARNSAPPSAASSDFGIRVAARSDIASNGLDYADGSCFTMHTIRVAREDGTDATRVISQSTCTPAARLQMKSAATQSSLQK